MSDLSAIAVSKLILVINTKSIIAMYIRSKGNRREGSAKSSAKATRISTTYQTRILLSADFEMGNWKKPLRVFKKFIIFLNRSLVIEPHC
jgi:hypothetical protein